MSVSGGWQPAELAEPAGWVKAASESSMRNILDFDRTGRIDLDWGPISLHLAGRAVFFLWVTLALLAISGIAVLVSRKRELITEVDDVGADRARGRAADLARLARIDVALLLVLAIAYPLLAWLAPDLLELAPLAALLCALPPVLSGDVEGGIRRAAFTAFGSIWICWSLAHLVVLWDDAFLVCFAAAATDVRVVRRAGAAPLRLGAAAAVAAQPEQDSRRAGRRGGGRGARAHAAGHGHAVNYCRGGPWRRARRPPAVHGQTPGRGEGRGRVAARLRRPPRPGRLAAADPAARGGAVVTRRRAPSRGGGIASAATLRQPSRVGTWASRARWALWRWCAGCSAASPWRASCRASGRTSWWPTTARTPTPPRCSPPSRPRPGRCSPLPPTTGSTCPPGVPWRAGWPGSCRCAASRVPTRRCWRPRDLRSRRAAPWSSIRRAPQHRRAGRGVPLRRGAAGG